MKDFVSVTQTYYLCKLQKTWELFFLFYEKWTWIYFISAVRGMMYYRRALKLQAFLDMASEEGKNIISLQYLKAQNGHIGNWVAKQLEYKESLNF